MSLFIKRSTSYAADGRVTRVTHAGRCAGAFHNPRILKLHSCRIGKMVQTEKVIYSTELLNPTPGLTVLPGNFDRVSPMGAGFPTDSLLAVPGSRYLD